MSRQHSCRCTCRISEQNDNFKNPIAPCQEFTRCYGKTVFSHYDDVIMSAIASQITSLTIVYSIVYSDADQRKHQSSASLAFVRGFTGGPVNSPHKWPVTRKMFPFDDVIMSGSNFRTDPLCHTHKIVWFVLCCQPYLYYLKSYKTQIFISRHEQTIYLISALLKRKIWNNNLLIHNF